MHAHYLVTLAPEKSTGTIEGESYAGNGEPVVPWYMPVPQNMFLSVSTFKFSPYAIVVVDDFDLDAMADKLVKEYPGIPRHVHENYVLATALAAAKMTAGTRVRPILTADEAHIQIVNESTVHTLWKKQPTKGKL